MTQGRHFSKLKKVIDGLFEPSLKMGFFCISYPMRSQCGSASIPRFYLKIGKEIIWDFPKDFPAKEWPFYYWEENNFISRLVREYIDTPIEILLNKKFEIDRFEMLGQDISSVSQDSLVIDFKLTELFRAADRRIGKEKLMEWSEKLNNPKVDYILFRRFPIADMARMSFRDRARWGAALLSMQGPVTYEQAQEQVRWLNEGTSKKKNKEIN